ncbi:PREDICTED: sodium channel protein type 5 subunit alpha-like [Nestor notabilis]|uniref:sodium channel protein type 5 subunit alpha-like n=1 Tax=Nestor notabilis TaxID=176057 RepID=UPI000523EBA2|nr:PREDICTED: sodium channel protein type 5 subunit alpha-like [Nestor notabilis]
MDPLFWSSETNNFRPFTHESLAAIEKRIAEKKSQQAEVKRENNDKEVEENKLTPKLDLKTCKTLPSLYGDLPVELIGEPLEDIDPYYSDRKTFMVLNKSRTIYRFTATPALCIIGPFNPVRKAAIKIMTHSLFTGFIICTVVLNCVSMTVNLPKELCWTEHIFTGIYTSEILIKVVAAGFVWNEFTFLRDAWNFIDFVITVITFATLYVTVGKGSALRTFRVLRTLKAISVISGLRVIVNSLIESVKRLADVLIFTVFCLSVFALVGLQLFMGNLTFKCVLNNTDYNDTLCKDAKIYIPNTQDICSRMNKSSDILLCGFSSNRDNECPKNYTCKPVGKNPDFGYTSFDHFGWAFLSVFRLMTQDYWERLYRQRQILLSYELSVDSVNDPFQRQRLMSAATVISGNLQMQKSKIKCPSQWKHLAQKCLIWNCCPFWRAVKEKVKLVILDPSADLLIMFCIIVNTLFMALEQPGVNSDYQKIISRIDRVFTLIFTAEMILKIIALDPYNYFQRKWNIFDSIVVMTDLISFKENLSYFRLLRIFKLAKFWPALNTLMKIILNSVGALGNLTLVLIITVFIFAVVGKQVLGTYYRKHALKISTDKQLRWHMEDFCHSFLIIFRILCGEWIETMWECMEVAGKGLCLPIFLLVLVIGNLVVLNLFIALLLNSFNTDSSMEQEEPGQMTKSQITIVQIHKGLRSVKDRILGHCGKIMKRSLKTTTKKKTLVKISAKDIEENDYAMTDVRKDMDNICFDMRYYNTEENCSVTRKDEEFLTSHSTCVPIAVAETYMDEGGDEHSVCTEIEYKNQGDRLRRREKCRNSSSFSQTSGTSETLSCFPETHQKKEQKEKYDGGSYSEASTADPVILLETFSQPKKSYLPKDCFTESCIECVPCCAVDTTKFPGRTWWNFRKTCCKIVKHSWFELFIIFMIILSSAALAFEDIHLQERQKVKMLLEYADKIFAYIFFMEILLKWVAYGLHSYFTNAWCWLDFIIVCLSFVSWGMNTASDSSLCSSGTALKSLRTLRALRPLRALSRFEGIKVVVNALLGAIPSILNVLLVCVVFWLLFNIAGVKLLGKKFWKCTLTEGNITLVHNKDNCTHFNGTWTNSDVNFDNVGMGYLALLQVATFKGWMDIMYAAVDAREIDEQPKFEAFLSMYIYFVVFIIFGSFFMLNLFIGVVISNFNQQRKKISGKDLFLTEEQKKYYNALKNLGSKKPQKPIPRPLNMFQGLLFDIVSHKAFDITVAVFICLNMVVMMAENNQNNIKNVLNKINFFFVAVFTAECAIKILALSRYFFMCGWNIFDLAVVILSLISTGLSEGFQAFFSPTLLRIFRLARIVRILRLIRQARGIRALLFALLMSLPALFNIGLLLFLVMFIYAIVGMTNFACLGWEGGIDNLFNFQTFDSSILCLFQITTSAGWDGLLAPLLKESNSCAPNLNLTSEQKKNCKSKGFGIFYFVSYVIISFLIVVNMYIAVILENFNIATEESTNLLCEDDFDMFYETWGKFDPQATQFIEYSALSDFADALAEPLRIPKPNKIQLISMDLPLVSGDKIHCLDVLLAFSKRVWGESGDLGDLETHIEEKFMADDPAKISCNPITTTLKRKQEEVSALIIQKAFRRYLVQCSSKKKPFLYHHKHHNSAVFEEGTREKESITATMLNEDNGRKLDKSWTRSSISLPLFYDGTAETGCPRLQHF